MNKNSAYWNENGTETCVFNHHDNSKHLHLLHFSESKTTYFFMFSILCIYVLDCF